MIYDTKKLLDAKGLIEAMWPEGQRPSVRWLREQTRRRQIPYIKISGFVWFDYDDVREALVKRKTIRARL